MSGIDNVLKWNCSTIFLLDPLGLEKSRLDKIGFMEAYLKDEYNNLEYENPVFLLFRPGNMNIFQAFVENEYGRVNTHTGTKDLRADYDRGNGEVVLVYEFPFPKDYQKFMEGKYSKFSEDIIKTYPKVKKSVVTPGLVLLGMAYRIITKDRDSEELLSDAYSDIFPHLQPTIVSMAEMLAERYGTDFTEDMELWKIPSFEKETLKYETRENSPTIKIS